MRQRTEIQRVPDGESLSRAAAGLFVRLAREAVEDRGRFTVALSGGSTPKRTFEQLAKPPFRDEVAWDRVEFFWGDERAVPADHADSNFRMAREALLAMLPVSPERVHRMPAEREDLDAAASDYQEEMARVFGVPPDGPPPSFDLILLGMGPDGHTASLFPHTEALRPTDRWVVPNYVPKLAAHRMTMTAEAINRAACVVFLVKGADKVDRLAEVLEGPDDNDRLPSRRVMPVSGRLIWMVDREAAAGLEGKTARRVCLAPSILSADFARLGEQVEQAEQGGADRIHVDVMDGHFVENISIGTPVVRALRTRTRLPLETHLMISEPDRYVEAFARAGSDSIIFHLEATADPRGLATRIRELGMGVGVTLRPKTPIEGLVDVIDVVDLALVMTVEPGFGGQALLPETVPKISQVREMIDARHRTCDLEVDGGIHIDTVGRVVKAGARVLVAGSAVFAGDGDIRAAMDRLLAAAAS